MGWVGLGKRVQRVHVHLHVLVEPTFDFIIFYEFISPINIKNYAGAEEVENCALWKDESGQVPREGGAGARFPARQCGFPGTEEMQLHNSLFR